MMNHLSPTIALAGVILLTVGVLAACSPQIEYRDIEVTREVDVVREVPVTVETVRDVEITREVPVTVETVRNVETTVTREVEITREVPVEVPVTRIATATPGPTTTPTVTTSAPEPTVAAATPTPAPTVMPTPTPAPKSKFDSWQIEHGVHAGRTVSIFRNSAISHDPLPDAPTITFLCDDRGHRSMYIDWRHPVVATVDTSLSSYVSDPFDVYRQVDADTIIVDYAQRLHEFMAGIRLAPQEKGRFDDLWRSIGRDYDLGTSTADEFLTQDERAEVSVNRGKALVQLDFAVEDPKRVGQDSYRPFVRAEIQSDWRVLPSQRTLMADGPIGSVKQSYEAIAPPQSQDDHLRILTAEIREPDQPVAMAATWEITGLDKMLEHCKRLRE